MTKNNCPSIMRPSAAEVGKTLSTQRAFGEMVSFYVFVPFQMW